MFEWHGELVKNAGFGMRNSEFGIVAKLNFEAALRQRLCCQILRLVVRFLSERTTVWVCGVGNSEIRSTTAMPSLGMTRGERYAWSV